ncbi:MAG: hypothetical protein N3E37_06130, partial [Candidatus Micrarchaeota archaeon]|nr:hypothetical protein [Candidatus Micrarchaeota archaeon]
TYNLPIVNFTTQNFFILIGGNLYYIHFLNEPLKELPNLMQIYLVKLPNGNIDGILMPVHFKQNLEVVYWKLTFIDKTPNFIHFDKFIDITK